MKLYIRDVLNILYELIIVKRFNVKKNLLSLYEKIYFSVFFKFLIYVINVYIVDNWIIFIC